MGTLRLLLAISVVITHTGPLFGISLIPGNAAVAAFFMISGFYMSLILSGKYAGRTGLFYSNRLARLFPSFAIGLVLALIAGKTDRFPVSLEEFAWPLRVLLMLPNAIIFGSDIPFATYYNTLTQQWLFPIGYVPSAPWVRASGFILNPPAWSLGFELWFYLMVPLLARSRTSFLVVIVILSATLRLWLESQMAWSSYFLFPANLWFFVLGMLAHRAWRSGLHRSILPNHHVGLAVLILLTIVLRNFIPGFRNYDWMLYVFAILSIPFLFSVTKSAAWDQWIGNLSYPIYILHDPLIRLSKNILSSSSEVVAFLIVIFGAIIVSVLIETPLDQWRQRRMTDYSVTAALAAK